MPNPTDRDRELADVAYSDIVAGVPWDVALRKLSSQARREGRREGVREALDAVEGEDALAVPRKHPFQAGLLRATTSIRALLEPAPEGEKP